MIKKIIFWVSFSIFSLACTIYSIKYFSSAFPIVSLNIDMNRKDALRLADSLATRYDWGPDTYRRAASFRNDRDVQYFVELEAGGKSKFKDMITSQLYMPYTWRVRHFKSNETNETLIRFTPDGSFYGFLERISEHTPGASLESDKAKEIAETFVSKNFKIDLAPFEQVEQSKKVQTSGRIDHTFIYERMNERLGEGKYRLRIRVSGDRVTEITNFIKIPESFKRRYREMRSSNTTIANTSFIAIILLYIIGGCIVGLYLLIRRRLVSWRGPLIWAIIIALFSVFNRINNLPLLWMNYDTALSMHVFLMNQFVSIIINFIGTVLFYSIIFMTAEGFTRKAFPHHIQFWKLWSPGVANTSPVLRRTLIGYMAVPIFFIFDIFLYLFATKLFGWWSPSDVLFEPDVLATYLPWFSSIAGSLNAGFMEECLFRAIPIAGAVIISKRYGYKWILIPAAFLIQAIIFGAGHANYVQQPAYARLVELIIPSLGFGLIYYFLGLLPAIIIHFLIDVVWMAIPLITSNAEGVWINHLIIILIVLIPVWIILIRRLSSGRWEKIKESDRNSSWKLPRIKSSKINGQSTYHFQPILDNRKLVYTLVFTGLLGLLAWTSYSSFRSVDPGLKVSRSDVKQLTEHALSERGIKLDSSWMRLISTVRPLSNDDKFVWQTGGPEFYVKMMHTYISPPLWRARIVRFEGDIVARAEEYHLFFDGKGTCIRFRHKIPEQWAGDSLSIDQAREIAQTTIQKNFSLNPDSLKETYASPIKHENRMDWIFTYSDTINYDLEQGDARIGVSISGNEVTDAFRYVHVPEKWLRDKKNRENFFSQIIILGDIFIFFLFTGALIGSIAIIKHKKFSIRLFLWTLIIIFVFTILDLFNRWPSIIADFSTSRPFFHQVFASLAFPLLGGLFLASGPALIMGFIHSLKRNQKCENKFKYILLAIFPAFLISGMYALLEHFFRPSLQPPWSDSNIASNLIPALGIAFSQLPNYIIDTIIALLLFIAMDRFSDGWTKKKFLTSFLFITTVFLIHGNNANSPGYWIIYGIISSIVYFILYLYVLRYQLSLIPLIMSIIVILDMIQNAIFNPYPHIIPGTVIGIVLILTMGVTWFLILCQDRNKLTLREI